MKTYGLKLIAGRAFSKSFGTDDSAVIFNRKAIEQLGFNKPEEALNKRIDFWGREIYDRWCNRKFSSAIFAANAYEPLILRLIPDVNGYLSVKTNGADAGKTINVVKAEWNKFFPGNTFDYFFLDEHFNDQYKVDQRFGQGVRIIYRPCNIGCMHGIIWACFIYNSSANKRNRDKKSVGRIGDEYFKITLPRICTFAVDLHL